MAARSPSVRSYTAPEDNKFGYDVDWRHKCVMSMFPYLSESDDRTLSRMGDDYVFSYREYIILEEFLEGRVGFNSGLVTVGVGAGSVFDDVASAAALYRRVGSDFMSERMDALLLCPEMEYGDIASVFGSTEGAVKAYERLFFNVRGDDGKMLPNRGMVEYFSLKDQPVVSDPSDYGVYWRKIASEGGHTSLFALWGWDVGGRVFTDMDIYRNTVKLAYQQFDHKLRFTNVDSKAFVHYLDSLQESFESMREQGILSGEEVKDTDELAYKLLEMLKPERVSASQDALDIRRKELDSKIGGMAADGAPGVSESGSLKYVTRQMNATKGTM